MHKSVICWERFPLCVFRQGPTVITCVCVYLHEHELLSAATEYHLGLLKAKLAKYRAQLLEPTGKAGAKVRFV